MKITFIFLISFLFLTAGCSSTENTANSKNMKVVTATYDHWSKAPQKSDVPEKGIDLTVTVQNWPEDYQPAFIVYSKRKSFEPSITDSTGNSIIIEARIIQASSMMAETSESVELSDRLVFTNANGEEGFVEIENWEPASD